MNAPDQLRKIASELRSKSTGIQEERLQKCAQILVAAQGLNLLKKRLTGKADK